jgi:glycosyltransferase involved in cell wall biosynthesis
MTAQGILFVSHDASRSGAPIALLHFLRWFKNNGNRPFSVMLGGDGELLSDFEEIAPTWSINWSHWRPGTRRTRLLNQVGFGSWACRAETNDARGFAAGCSPGLVYANSIASARAIDVLALDVPVLTYVHELKMMIQKLWSPHLERLLVNTRQFVAGSRAVQENLIREHGVAPKRIEIVHESIRVDQIRAGRTREEILRELGMPDDAQLVMGIGIGVWRKGIDIFVRLTKEVCQQNRRAHFVWIGCTSDAPVDVDYDIDYDIRTCGLTGRIRFLGMLARYAEYLAAADVFALTSREDPYPLVCLEAAALGKPIVCFAGAGGAPEFVEQDCGFVVPYLDVTAMAGRIASLLESADCRIKMGTVARRKVTERHDISVAAPRILEIIERTIARH